MGYGSEGLPTVIPVTDIEFIKARTNTVRAINTQKIVANELFITIFTKIIYNMKNYSSFLMNLNALRGHHVNRSVHNSNELRQLMYKSE